MFTKYVENKQRQHRPLFVDITHVSPTFDKSGNRCEHDNVEQKRYENITSASRYRLGLLAQEKNAMIRLVEYTPENTGLLVSWERYR